MAAYQVSDQLAAEIALSVSDDALQHALDLPPGGEFILYNNQKYLLAIRNNKYVAFASNVQAYDSEGNILSDSWDVWLDTAGNLPEILLDSVRESIPEAKIVIPWAMIGLGIFAFLMLRK